MPAVDEKRFASLCENPDVVIYSESVSDIKWIQVEIGDQVLGGQTFVVVTQQDRPCKNAVHRL